MDSDGVKDVGKGTDELSGRCTDTDEVTSVELRKARKEEQLSKRRQIGTDELDSSLTASPTLENGNHEEGGETGGSAQISEVINQILKDIYNTDPIQQLKGTILARKILSRERHPPIDLFINAGAVPRCIEFISDDTNAELCLEAAWVLTNIASGTSSQTDHVVKAGAVEPFVKLLKSQHTTIVEQSVWALGNIAGDGPAMRDLVIQKGTVPLLVELTKSEHHPQFLQNVAWTLSNLCRVKTRAPQPVLEATMQCLPALSKLIEHSDMEIISDACWALSYLTDGPNEKIEEVVKSNVVPRLVHLLSFDKQANVIIPCLRAVGNIVTGSDTQTQYVVKAGVLGPLAKLLKSPKTTIVKEAAWTVSNICAGTVEQINAVIAAGLVPILIHVLRTGDFRAQKEAAWAITNITSGSGIDHLGYLCQSGAIPVMCDALSCRDWRTIITVMDWLENILRGAQDVGQLDIVAVAIEECGGLDKIEQLQSHDNNTVYNKAYALIDQFFSDENSVDENILPQTNANGDFDFNVDYGVPEGGFNV